MDISALPFLIITILVVITIIIFLLPSLTGAPYVPTLKANLKNVFTKLYPLGKDDLLIDLGAGDGVILDAATKFGAKAIGLEINPILTLIMKHRFHNNKKATVKCCNFYNYKFPKNTTVVYAFAVSLHIEKIHQKISSEATRLGRPIFFISNAFDLKSLKPQKKLGTFYLYKISPSK